MKKILSYIKPAIHGILHNKAYASFCVIGTAFTFVFIIITLQLAYTLTGKTPPFVNAERTIVLKFFESTKGESIGGIPVPGMVSFIERIKGFEEYSLYYSCSDNVFARDIYRPVSIVFTNGGYWKMNQFDFVEGRPFTEQECKDKEALIVIRENIADMFFKGASAVGQKMDVQGKSYTVIGVMANYSTFAIRSDEVLLPYTMNKFVPSGIGFCKISILFPREMNVQSAKERVAAAVRFFWDDFGVQVDISPDKLQTFQEERISDFGSDLFSYGLPVVILLLLVIPAINIVTLNVANVSNHTLEIALRRALGATVFASFVQMIMEVFILVILGIVLGLCLTLPVANWIGTIFFDSGSGGRVSLIEHLDYRVVLYWMFPLALVFTLLSGGIPAYLVAKGNIAVTLKGGSK